MPDTCVEFNPIVAGRVTETGTTILQVFKAARLTPLTTIVLPPIDVVTVAPGHARVVVSAPEMVIGAGIV
jgi:hypothetical protein